MIKNDNSISRKQAIKKISSYGKYAALTALGTYIILNPQKSQAFSESNPIEPGGDDF